MRYTSIIFFCCAFVTNIISISAQNRTPEIRITPKQTTEATDTFGFDERPYFLLVEQSEKALKEQDYDAAALRLIEAMSVEPANPLNVALMSNLGMIYYYNEQDSLALATLDEAIRRSPRLLGAREHRARVLIGLGRDSEAYDEYEAILRIDSVNTDARFYHGMMALYNGALDKAKADFTVLGNVVPLARETVLANATMNAMTGNNIDAVHGFRKLLELEKKPEYYAQLAGCLIETGNLDDASKTLGDAIALFPDDAELFYYRAKLNNLRYLADDAQRDAAKAIKLGANPKRVARIFLSDYYEP